MDLEFNAISPGVDYSQLTDFEKVMLRACVERLTPFGWTAETLASWFRNRKLAVLRIGAKTHYYGLTPAGKWRMLLLTKQIVEQEQPILTWKVKNFQWQPIEGAS